MPTPTLNIVLLFKDIQDYYVLLMKPSVCLIYFADFIFKLIFFNNRVYQRNEKLYYPWFGK